MNPILKMQRADLAPMADQRARFRAVAAIEGLNLSKRMEAAFREFDRQGLDPKQRRAAIRAMFAR